MNERSDTSLYELTVSGIVGSILRPNSKENVRAKRAGFNGTETKTRLKFYAATLVTTTRRTH